MDKLMEKTMFKGQQSDQPPRHDLESLERAADNELRERGEAPRHVSESSLYTRLSMHPALTSAVVMLAGIALAGVLGRTNSRVTRVMGRSLSRGMLNKLINSLS